MPWVKIDEAFYDHPKFVDLTAGAIGLWVIGLAYSNRYLLDGALSKRGLARAYPGADREKHARTLVSVGLWDVTDDGWQIHDYLKYQPSKAKVEAQRSERSAAGKKGAASRWGEQEPPPDPPDEHGGSHNNSHGPPHDNSNGKPDAPSRPVPSPLSTSPRHGSPPASSTGPLGTTTTGDRHPEAVAACQLLAEQALERRRAEVGDGEPPPGIRTERWLTVTAEDHWAAVGPQLQALATAGDRADAIVAKLAHPAAGPAPPQLAVVRSLPVSVPPPVEPAPDAPARLAATRDALRRPKDQR